MLALFTTDDASRVLAAVSLAWSAMLAVALTFRMHAVFAWHLLFCAFWSLVAAIGMISLLDDVPVPIEPVFVEVLNVSWTLTLSSWLLFVWRVHRAARKAVAA